MSRSRSGSFGTVTLNPNHKKKAGRNFAQLFSLKSLDTLPTLKLDIVPCNNECPLIGVIDAAITEGLGWFIGIVNQDADVVTSLRQICKDNRTLFANVIASKSTLPKRCLIQINRDSDGCAGIILQLDLGRFTGRTGGKRRVARIGIPTC